MTVACVNVFDGGQLPVEDGPLGRQDHQPKVVGQLGAGVHGAGALVRAIPTKAVAAPASAGANIFASG